MRPIFTISSSAAVEQISFCFFLYFCFSRITYEPLFGYYYLFLSSPNATTVSIPDPFKFTNRIAFSTFLYSAHEKRAFIGYRV